LRGHGGHNIEQTVFLECRSMYKKDSPQELAQSETEFSRHRRPEASGQCRNTAVAGIVGFADLTGHYGPPF
jgi:hypothetical protein